MPTEADGVRFSEVDAGSPAAQQAVDSYFTELAERFDGGFDVSAYRRAGAAGGAEVFVIATLAGRPVGCGALQSLGADVAEIKRMWVDPGSRGLGLGRRLLADLERRDARRGWSVVRLDTNAALTEAIALYERSSYRTIPPVQRQPVRLGVVREISCDKSATLSNRCLIRASNLLYCSKHGSRQG